jgi:hypothetical protein
MAITLNTKAKHVVVKLPCTAKAWAVAMDDLHLEWWLSLTDEERGRGAFDDQPRPIQPAISIMGHWPVIVKGKLEAPHIIAFYEEDREEIERSMKAMVKRDLVAFRAFEERGLDEMAAAKAAAPKAAVIHPKI